MSDDREQAAERKRGNEPGWLDQEFRGKHGTVASEKSLTEEHDPSFHPQNAHEAVRKVSEESEGEGVLGTAQKLFEEVDRQVSGTYERREEGSSARSLTPGDNADRGDAPRTPDPAVAAPEVTAEEERFDGLVNEAANPPRQPGLQHSNRGDRAGA